MIIILMGISGSGKTTVGRLLAERLGWRFYEGDDFHPQVNIDKMRNGVALTDADRDPWLSALRQRISGMIREDQSALITCSALEQSYRDRLSHGPKEAVFVYLKGDYDLIHQRLLERHGHFMNTELLKSQLDTLEEPVGVVTVSITQAPGAIVAQIRRELGC